MKSSLTRAILVFLVGTAGWLLAAALRVENEAAYLSLVAVGLVAGVVAGRVSFLPLLWVGWLAAIPVALVLGLLAYVEVNWEAAFYLVLAFALLALGFVAGLLVARFPGLLAAKPQRRQTG
ncbi:MAG TPA: hypothetical protein VFR93_08515 [Candidatus Limnocylindrales bacterium]|nr:hypothetical protein [Candidatus Limnocylindrales bacterium]